MKRIIVFRHRRSPGEHDFLEEEIRVDVEDTENDIREMFKEWVWENVGENATWLFCASRKYRELQRKVQRLAARFFK
ncbi:TPA: hypothetical protein QCY08_002483 [Bacillus paranthracis]|nr:hypothetical protein [Bacillus paranthracis]